MELGPPPDGEHLQVPCAKQARQHAVWTHGGGGPVVGARQSVSYLPLCIARAAAPHAAEAEEDCLPASKQPRSSLAAASGRAGRQAAGRQAGREAVARCGRCERWVGRTFGLSRGDKSPLKRQDLPGDRRLQLEKVRRFFPHLNSSSAEEPRQNQIAVETAFRGLHFPLLPSFRPGFEGGRGEEARSLGRSCCRREREREIERRASIGAGAAVSGLILTLARPAALSLTTA